MPTTTAVVRDLDFSEIEAMLKSHRYGRLAFSFRDRVDIEPIHYVYEAGWLYGRTSPGTKLTVLAQLAKKVDELIVGGGIANTFMLAAGLPVGKSLVERDLVDEAKRIMQATRVPLPEDVVVGKSLEDARGVTKAARAVGADEMILDVGPKTAAAYAGTLAGAGTILWNGPVGVFENAAFSKGTETLARAVAASGAFSIAGGGDTVAAINKFGMAEGVSYISTAGGAFLEFLEGKTLPAVAVLEERA